VRHGEQRAIPDVVRLLAAEQFVNELGLRKRNQGILDVEEDLCQDVHGVYMRGNLNDGFNPDGLWLQNFDFFYVLAQIAGRAH